MRYLLTAFVLLSGAVGVSAAQDIHGVEPGMTFPEAERKLKEAGTPTTVDSTEGVYRSTFQVGSGFLTIAASKKEFESRSEARVQWISFEISAEKASASKVQRVCRIYRSEWRKLLGKTRRDSLSGGALWKWEGAALDAKVLCQVGENAKTQVFLMSEPVLLSGR